MCVYMCPQALKHQHAMTSTDRKNVTKRIKQERKTFQLEENPFIMQPQIEGL